LPYRPITCMLFWGSSDLDSKLSKKIESDVEELKKQLSERQLGKPMSRQVDRIAQESAEIMNWLSPFNFWQNQNDNFAAHQEGTGEWLIQGSPEFNEWLNGTNRILWCSGNRMLHTHCVD